MDRYTDWICTCCPGEHVYSLPSTGRPLKGRRLLRENQIVRAGVACIPRRYNYDAGTYEVLLLQRAGSHGAGTWSVPGGWVEYGETLRMAASRELEEEVGIHVDPLALEYIDVTNDFFEDEGKHCLTVWFGALLTPDAKPRNCEPNKATELRWVDPYGSLPEPLFLPLKNYLAAGLEL